MVSSEAGPSFRFFVTSFRDDAFLPPHPDSTPGRGHRSEREAVKRYPLFLLRTLALLAVAIWVLVGRPVALLAADVEPGGEPTPKPKAAALIQLSVPAGRPPLELAGEGDSFRGIFEVKNLGPGELDVTRVAVHTSQADPRTPAGVEATFDDGKPNAHLTPGASKRVV